MVAALIRCFVCATSGQCSEMTSLSASKVSKGAYSNPIEAAASAFGKGSYARTLEKCPNVTNVSKCESKCLNVKRTRTRSKRRPPPSGRGRTPEPGEENFVLEGRVEFLKAVINGMGYIVDVRGYSVDVRGYSVGVLTAIVAVGRVCEGVFGVG
eukprot:404483-Prorocentrum_minimum.AAC.5